MHSFFASSFLCSAPEQQLPASAIMDASTASALEQQLAAAPAAAAPAAGPSVQPTALAIVPFVQEEPEVKKNKKRKAHKVSKVPEPSDDLPLISLVESAPAPAKKKAHKGRRPAGVEKEANPDDEIPHDCVWNCGIKQRRQGDMTQCRNKTSPLWGCGSCSTAYFALTNMGKVKKATVGKALGDLRVNDPEEFAALVRSLRVVEPDSNQPGIGTHRDRKLAINQFCRSVEQSMSVTQSTKIHWCNRDEFISRHMYKKNLSQKAAEALWEKQAGDKKILSRGSGDLKEIPVKGTSTTQGSVTRTLKRTMNCAVNIRDLAEENNAMQDLDSLGKAGLVDDNLLGMGGDIFRPHVVSGAGSSSDILPTSGILAQVTPPPLPRSMIPQPDKEPSTRILRRTASDARRAAVPVAPLSLVTAKRSQALEIIKDSLVSFGKRSNNMGNLYIFVHERLIKVLETADKSLAKGRADAEEYLRLLLDLAQIKKSCLLWTMKNVDQKYKDLEATVKRLNDLHVALDLLIVTCKSDLSKRQNIVDHGRRKQAQGVARATKNYNLHGLPQSWGQVLVRLHWITADLGEDSDLDKVTDANHMFKSTMMPVPVDTTCFVNRFWTKPQWFSAGSCSLPARPLLDLTLSGSYADRLRAAMTTVIQGMEKTNKYRVCGRVDNSEILAALDQRTWLPPDLSDLGVPEGLKVFAQVGIRALAPGATFTFSAFTPFPGLPCLYSCLASKVLVGILDLNKAIEMGVELKGSWEWFAAMSAPDFGKIGCEMIELSIGDVLWVPAGYAAWAICKETSDRHVGLVVPYLASKLITTIGDPDIQKAILQWNLNMVHANLKSDVQKDVNKHQVPRHHAFAAWVESLMDELSIQKEIPVPEALAIADQVEVEGSSSYDTSSEDSAEHDPREPPSGAESEDLEQSLARQRKLEEQKEPVTADQHGPAHELVGADDQNQVPAHGLVLDEEKAPAHEVVTDEQKAAEEKTAEEQAAEKKEAEETPAKEKAAELG